MKIHEAVSSVTEKILEKYAEPMNPGFKYYKNDPRRPVYISNGKPKAFFREVIVLPGYGAYAEKRLCVPVLVGEFDFFNEYLGFIKFNKLNPKEIDYTKESLGYCDYAVDIENMTLYRYEYMELA